MNHVADNVTYWHDLHYTPPSTLAGRWHKKEKKERGEKRADTLEKRNPTRGRVRGGWKVEAGTRAACGAAYGAWLPIVKGAAYLTDFTVDRSSRENPGCVLVGPMCARCPGNDSSFDNYCRPQFSVTFLQRSSLLLLLHRSIRDANSSRNR